MDASARQSDDRNPEHGNIFMRRVDVVILDMDGSEDRSSTNGTRLAMTPLCESSLAYKYRLEGRHISFEGKDTEEHGWAAAMTRTCGVFYEDIRWGSR